MWLISSVGDKIHPLGKTCPRPEICRLTASAWVPASTGCDSTVPSSRLKHHVRGLLGSQDKAALLGNSSTGTPSLPLLEWELLRRQQKPSLQDAALLQCSAETDLQQLQLCRVPQHISVSPSSAGESSLAAPRFPVKQTGKKVSPLGFVSFSVFHLKCFYCDL